MLTPAESVMPWDLFIYKATLLAVVDLTSCGSPSVHIVILYGRILSYCSPVCMHDCAY